MSINSKLRYLRKEFPKVAFLILVGAVVTFPMYMMVVISLMTPAQLERFPWFPLTIADPQRIAAERPGTVEMAVAALTLQPAAGGPARQVSLPVDPRFYVYMKNENARPDTWQVAPETAPFGETAAPSAPAAGQVARVRPKVIAEYRAANVWAIDEVAPAATPGEGQAVAPAGGAAYTIDYKPFKLPEGFVSLLPSLRKKAMVEKELQVIDAAFRQATEAMRGAKRSAKVDDPALRTVRENEAAAIYRQTLPLVARSEPALLRATVLAAEAARGHVSVDAEIAAAGEKLRVARVNCEEARRHLPARLLPGAAPSASPSATAEAAVAVPASEWQLGDPVPTMKSFRVDRGEAVALLLATEPLTVTRQAGRLTVRTAWEYDLQRRRLFQVRPLVAPTGPAGRDVVPGEKLAELVADRRVEARWDGGDWTIDGVALRSYVPAGFTLLVADGSAGQWGELRTIAAGEVIARAVGPKVVVDYREDALLVGLATPGAEGKFRLVTVGDGYWSYGLRVDRDVPFAVRLSAEAAREVTAQPSAAAGEYLEIALPAGRPLAQLYVNRQRAVEGLAASGWVTEKERISLKTPPGFTARFAAPTATQLPERKVFLGDTVLAEIVVPRATLTVDDQFVVVSLTGSQWGSGQWEWPLGELEPLQIVATSGPGAAPGAAPGAGPWCVRSGAEIAEVRATRRTTLDYVDQHWMVEGREVTAWSQEETVRVAKNNLELATRALAGLDPQPAAAAPTQPAAATSPASAALAQAREAEALAARRLNEVEQATAFVPLAGPGQSLSAERARVIVEPGTVLARFAAVAPHPAALAADPTCAVVTTVSAGAKTLRAEFAQELTVPVQANIAAGIASGATVLAKQELFSYFKPQRFDTANYTEAWIYVRDLLWNTVFVAVATMILSIFFASLSAFVFSRFEFPGKAVLYGMVIVLLMIPGVLNLVPMYVVVKTLGLLSESHYINLLALILPAVAGGQVMNVYIMRNNLETLAKDLFDAARIDGASNFQTYRHIALPLTKPIMGTLAIFVLLSQWNDFIWPWVVIKEQKNMTVTAGLALLEGQNLSDYGLQMAGAVLASLPLIVLFFFTMNLFIRGMQSGAIKA